MARTRKPKKTRDRPRIRQGFGTNELLFPLALSAIALSMSTPILQALRLNQAPSVYDATIAGGLWLVCAVLWVRCFIIVRTNGKSLKQHRERAKDDPANDVQE